MRLFRYAIGIRFKEKMFRLSSLSGQLIDEILKLREESKIISNDYFNQVQHQKPITGENDFLVALLKDDKTNELIITPEQFILKRTASEGASLNAQNCQNEFEELWKKADKLLKFNSARRLGFLGEYRMDFEPSDNSLIEILTKLKTTDDITTKFRIELENRSFNDAKTIPDPEIDAFTNVIRHIYLSSMDETPDLKSLNANIDVQQYYNPLKTNPIREFRNLDNIYKQKKGQFLAELQRLGLSTK